jgi:hypothetical protein
VKSDVQYEQRDGESEHTIAESFHPALAENTVSARRVLVIWHGIPLLRADRVAPVRTARRSAAERYRVQIAWPGAATSRVSAGRSASAQ